MAHSSDVKFMYVRLPKQLEPKKRDQLTLELMDVLDRLRAQGWSAEEFLLGLAEQCGSLAGALQAVHSMQARQALAELQD